MLFLKVIGKYLPQSNGFKNAPKPPLSREAGHLPLAHLHCTNRSAVQVSLRVRCPPNTTIELSDLGEENRRWKWYDEVSSDNRQADRFVVYRVLYTDSVG